MLRTLVLTTTAALVTGTLLAAPVAAEPTADRPDAEATQAQTAPRMRQADIVRTLPPVRRMPARLGLDPDSTRGIVAVPGVDHPEVCHLDAEPRLPGTREWAAGIHEGTDDAIVVVRTWSYGERATRAWRVIRADLASCQGTERLEQDGVAPEVTVSTKVRGDLAIQRYRARSVDSHERLAAVVVFQQVGDAVQMIEVGRTRGASRPGDAQAARTIARVAAQRYLAVYTSGVRATPTHAPAEPVTAITPGSTSGEVAPEPEVATIPGGTPVAVSLGDSYISGEAGRWGGNTISSDYIDRVDRLGPEAYWDTPTGESTERCHRSTSAEIGFWSEAVNHACSGAKTFSFWSGNVITGRYAKPGIDFDTSNGLNGQLNLLMDTAKAQPVPLVVLSIGGNDLGFGDIVTECVKDFATSSRYYPTYCQNSDLLKNAFSATGMQNLRTAVSGAIQRTVSAMRQSGYTDDSWTLMVQSYPAPMPTSSGMRYDQSWDRITKGGCGVWNSDLDYLIGQMPNIRDAVFGAVSDAETATGKKAHTLDVVRLLEGRRLCETGTQVADEATRDELVSVGERVESIRTDTAGTPFFIQESLHPNYFGQMALRNCLRQAWNGGTPRSGACLAPTSWGTVDANGEPAVRFTAS